MTTKEVKAKTDEVCAYADPKFKQALSIQFSTGWHCERPSAGEFIDKGNARFLYQSEDQLQPYRDQNPWFTEYLQLGISRVLVIAHWCYREKRQLNSQFWPRQGQFRLPRVRSTPNCFNLR